MNQEPNTKRINIFPKRINSTANIIDLQEGEAPLILNMDTTLSEKKSIRDGFVADFGIVDQVLEFTKNNKFNVEKLKLIKADTVPDISVPIYVLFANATLTDGSEKYAIAIYYRNNFGDDELGVILKDKAEFYNIDALFGNFLNLSTIKASAEKFLIFDPSNNFVGYTNKLTYTILLNANWNKPGKSANGFSTLAVQVNGAVEKIQDNESIIENFGEYPIVYPTTSSNITLYTAGAYRYEILNIPNVNLKILGIDGIITSRNGASAVGHIIAISDFINDIDSSGQAKFRYIGFISEEEYLLGVHSMDSIPILVSNKNIYKLIQNTSVLSAPYVIESVVEKIYPIHSGVMVGNHLFILCINGIYRIPMRQNLFNVEDLAVKISDNYFLFIKNNLQSIEYVDGYYDAQNSKVVFILNMNNEWLNRLYKNLGTSTSRSTSRKCTDDDARCGLSYPTKTIMITISATTNETNIQNTPLIFKGKLANYNNYKDVISRNNVTNTNNPGLYKDLEYNINNNLKNTLINDVYSFIDEDFIVYTQSKLCNQDDKLPFNVIYGFNINEAIKDANKEFKQVNLIGLDIVFSSRINIKSSLIKDKIFCAVIEHEESIMDMTKEFNVKRSFLTGDMSINVIDEYRLINKIRIPEIKEVISSGSIYIAFQSEIFSTLISAYLTYNTNTI